MSLVSFGFNPYQPIYNSMTQDTSHSCSFDLLIQEWWTARRQSGQFFSTAITIEPEFIESDVKKVSRFLKQRWSDTEFVG